MTSSGFRTTRWSRVVAAGAEASDTEALAELCSAYWYPLYAYARRTGESQHDAADRVQSFFAELLEKNVVGQADRERGRFRSFLIAAFRHHVSRRRESERALKRGGGRTHLSLDFDDGERRYSIEPADHMTPDRIYERRFALTLLDRVVATLRSEMDARGLGTRFEALLPFVVAGAPLPSHADVGTELGLSANAVKVSVHRLRRRYRDVLRAAVADIVSDPAQVDDELANLVDALG